MSPASAVHDRHATYVFLGPTLDADAATELLGAPLLPPVACGDVYRLVRDARPRRIAIIDGYFERMAAVWHKEILFALEAGVEVWGASSMGALRAAELHRFGMRGVGRVFAAYKAGRLVDDDEVAVVHGPAELGYPVMSTAMVDLRAGLAALVAAGAIGARDAAHLIVASKARFYRERSWSALVADAARVVRLSRRGRAAIEALAAAAPSQKAADARALLRRLARTPIARGARPSWRLPRTWFWDRLVELIDAES